MNQAKIVALVLLAFALALIFFGLVSTIAPLISGFESTLVRTSEVIRIEQHPFVLGRPGVQSAMGFFVFVLPGSLAGVLGILLWRRADRRSRQELLRERELESWGDEALSWWLDRLAESCRQELDLSALISRGRVEIQPHLAQMQAHWMSGFLSKFSGECAERRIDVAVRVPRAKGRVVLRLLIIFLFMVAGFSVLWGGLSAAMLLWFRKMPILEQEVNTAMLVLGFSFPLAMTAFSASLGAGLLRLDQQSRRQKKEEANRKRRLSSTLIEESLKRTEGFLSMGTECSSRLASSLLVATSAVVDSMARRELLLGAFRRGLLSKEKPLDLRDANFCGVDLEGTELAGIHLTAVRLDEANLMRSRFDQAVLDGCSLHRARVQNASFHKASLRSVSFEGASCQQACFLDADLCEVSFTEANLWQAQFDPLHAHADRAGKQP